MYIVEFAHYIYPITSRTDIPPHITRLTSFRWHFFPSGQYPSNAEIEIATKANDEAEFENEFYCR